MENEEKEIEKYVLAVKEAVKEAPLRKDDAIDVTDLWLITSLPIDLIEECLKEEGFELPAHVKKVIRKGRIILENRHYFPSSDDKKNS